MKNIFLIFEDGAIEKRTIEDKVYIEDLGALIGGELKYEEAVFFDAVLLYDTEGETKDLEVNSLATDVMETDRFKIHGLAILCTKEEKFFSGFDDKRADNISDMLHEMREE